MSAIGVANAAGAACVAGDAAAAPAAQGCSRPLKSYGAAHLLHVIWHVFWLFFHLLNCESLNMYIDCSMLQRRHVCHVTLRVFGIEPGAG